MSTVQGDIVCNIKNDNKRYGENVILNEGMYSEALREAIDKKNMQAIYGKCRMK